MSNGLHRWHRALAAGAIVSTLALVPIDIVGAGAGNSAVIGTGPDYVYGSPNPLADATATVSLAAIGEGNVQFALVVDDVDAPAGTTFGAHLHVHGCGPSGGVALGHYADANAHGSLQHHEIWLDFTINAHGHGRAVATRNFEIPDLADRSVIIHALPTAHDTGVAGARLACIDLEP